MILQYYRLMTARFALAKMEVLNEILREDVQLKKRLHEFDGQPEKQLAILEEKQRETKRKLRWIKWQMFTNEIAMALLVGAGLAMLVSFFKSI